MIASLLLCLAPAIGADPLLQEPTTAPAEAKAPASTSPFAYTYGQFDFVRGDADGFDDGPDGFDLKISYALKDQLFLFGGLGLLSGDIGNTSIDTNTFGAGLGYHMPLSPVTDLVFGASLLYANTDSGGPGGSADGGGWCLQAGVRNNASAQFELDGTIGVTDYSGSSANTWIEIGAVYHASANIGICAALMTSDDIDTLSLGIRYQP